jgi:hypothetical protein
MGPPAPALGQRGKPNININSRYDHSRPPDNQSWNEIRETAALVIFDTASVARDERVAADVLIWFRSLKVQGTDRP